MEGVKQEAPAEDPAREAARVADAVDDAAKEEEEEPGKEEAKEELKEDLAARDGLGIKQEAEEARREEMMRLGVGLPFEREEDAPPDHRPRLSVAAEMSHSDSTLNVVPTANGRLLMALSDAGMQHLMAAARANVGLKGGRHIFEVRVMGLMEPAEAGRRMAPMLSKRVVRVGFSLGGSSLFLGDSEESVCFDSEGFFYAEGRRAEVGVRFARDQVVGVLLNLDPSSPSRNTVSLFRDGRRASAPQPLPGGLLGGRPLHPHVNYRNVALQVHFGPEPLATMPFQCRTVQGAAEEDVAVVPPPGPRDGKYDLVLPIALPDEGTFDWLDGFMAKNPSFTELSDRKILDWAMKSGISCVPLSGQAAATSNDKPRVSSGIPTVDDLSMRRLVYAAAQMNPRNYVIMEVKSNLIKSERKELLQRFSASTFRRVAQVVMGEPPQEYKAEVLGATLREKQERAQAQWQSAKARQSQALAGEDGVAEVGAQEAPDRDEDPPVVELSAEEEKLWFRRQPLPDLSPSVLNSSFASFSLPSAEEGFSETRWEWQDAAGSKQYLLKWLRERKMRIKVDSLQPSQWFTTEMTTWHKRVQEWQSRWEKSGGQQADNDPGAAEAASKPDPEAEKKEEAEIFLVQDVSGAQGGKPLFAMFALEDWALMMLSFELVLLLRALRRDLEDPHLPGVHEPLFTGYYAKYFQKQLNPSLFGVGSTAELLELVRDAIYMDKDGVVSLRLPEERYEDCEMLLKLTEIGRRARRRRIRAGDEGAKLRFTGNPCAQWLPPPPEAPPPPGINPPPPKGQQVMQGPQQFHQGQQQGEKQAWSPSQQQHGGDWDQGYGDWQRPRVVPAPTWKDNKYQQQSWQQGAAGHGQQQPHGGAGGGKGADYGGYGGGGGGKGGDHYGYDGGGKGKGGGDQQYYGWKGEHQQYGGGYGYGCSHKGGESQYHQPYGAGGKGGDQQNPHYGSYHGAGGGRLGPKGGGQPRWQNQQGPYGGKQHQSWR